MTTFERIKKLARKQGMTLAQLNEAAGLGKNSIYHWSTKTPSTDNLKKVADQLHVSVDYLLGNTDNPLQASSRPSDPVDLAGTNIFTYQGKPIRKDDWEIIQAILARHDRETKKKGNNVDD
ncbi:helix-turn-helix domain-containing protein [Lacticaseibacillus salsurivasis]|uniref:helix-turn-helix domain-containing protein n=1 Tax=Lacticaseibacillus salsurivasis TaxID=3081441 RepID=UPI0030C75D84